MSNPITLSPKYSFDCPVPPLKRRPPEEKKPMSPETRVKLLEASICETSKGTGKW